MIEVIRKVSALLSPNERKQAYLLLGMILVMALLDIVGIASIMPFMAVLANPEVIQSNRWLSAVYVMFGFRDEQRFLFFLGIVVFVALVTSVVFKALTTWAITHFTQLRNYSIGRRLVGGYLAQPYEWFLNRHSAELGKTILSEVQMVVANALIPLMQLLAQGAVIIAILVLLIVVNPTLALVVGAATGGAYAAIYFVLRNLLRQVGKDRVAADKMRFEAVSEAFGGIKELKLSGFEASALQRFSAAAKRFARAQLIAQIVALLPRFVLEIIAFGGILLLTLLLMQRSEGLQSVLPVIALYTLAGYRLMPALQMAYDQATKLRFCGTALDRLHRDLGRHREELSNNTNSIRVIHPERSIHLNNVSYIYPESKLPAVNGLSLGIDAHTTVALVGETGSGKTTVADIILGLLEPQSGTLCVDGVEITRSNRRHWQRSIGYVPQQIFLFDETISSNIAFGLPKDVIDRRAVERAASAANLHEFIVNELPEGYETIIGERGIRLSGGQRQRIGIARAIYHQPKVIVLDEATSALDGLTEQAVMDAVQNLDDDMTIIMIAHRLTTVRDCDRIFVLQGGRLVDEGTFQELTATNARFRAMADT